MLHSEAVRLRAAEIELLMASCANYMLTLTSKPGLNAEYTRTKISYFFIAAMANFYGRDWTVKEDFSFPEAHGYLEHPDSNLHYHLLLKCDPSLGYWLEICGQAHWHDQVGRQNFDIQAVALDSLHKAAKYCTKDLARNFRFDDIYRFTDTRKITIGGPTHVPGKES